MRTKKTIFLLLGIMSMTSVFSQLTSGLIAYYSFGGNANDLSGQGHNGVLIGTPVLTTDRFNTANCAYQFPGDTSVYIKINYGTDFNISANGALSISLWYQGGTSSTFDLETLFGKINSATNPANDYYLGLYDLNNPAFGNAYSVAMTFNTPPIPDANWHHVVGVYNDRKWYLYENGSLVASDISQTYTITQSAGSISVGKGFGGRIDDIRFYNRALSASEITQIYALPGSCAAVGIEERQIENAMKIFPNPSESLFNIETTQNKMALEVYDVLGSKIISFEQNGHSSVLDLTGFAKGVYFIKFAHQDFKECKKLILK